MISVANSDPSRCKAASEFLVAGDVAVGGLQRLRKGKEKATGIDGEADEPCIDGEIKEN
jgi:hypothetical protein